MINAHLSKTPYNIIIAGGEDGQGHVTTCYILANMLIRKGLQITVGETFSRLPRKSAASHLRVSFDTFVSPQIPEGMADLAVFLGPGGAAGVLDKYGNDDIKILINSRTFLPYDSGDNTDSQPSFAATRDILETLSSQIWVVDAADKALELGNPILENMIMIGALAGTGTIPIALEDFKEVITEIFPSHQINMNMTAFETGVEEINNKRDHI